MMIVPAVLLRHHTPDGVHHDWLVGTPQDRLSPDARLWSARVRHPSRLWRRLGRFDLETIQPHRRAYLRYQGPISGHRGWVTRTDHGNVALRLWTPKRMILDVRFHHFAGLLRIDRLSDRHWRAVIQRAE
ncbi:MAG: hypothetical protein Kow00105_08370 [Phycisphaeraceae bacterium]